MSVKTIKMEPLRKHLGYILYTGFIENIKRYPSTLILAYPERGKTTEAQRWTALGAMEIQDLSSWGLLNEIRHMTEKERADFHHVVIPDLEKLATKGKKLKEELLSTIRILSDEGFLRSKVRGQTFTFDPRVQIGFILCTTPEDIGDRRSVFRSYSLLSRFIPFTFDYSLSMKAEILEYIESENSLAKETITIKREEKEYVKVRTHHLKALNPIVKLLSKEIDEISRKSSFKALKNRKRDFGVRMKENLTSYLQAIALYDGYNEVRRKHVDELLELSHFFNFDFNYIDEVEMNVKMKKRRKGQRLRRKRR